MSRDILEIAGVFQDTLNQWEKTVVADHHASVELAIRLNEVADTLARASRGMALSIYGGTLLLTGDLQTGEQHLYEAMLLQKEDDLERAATIRRLAFLRATQRSFGEAVRLMESAMEINKNRQAEERLGKDYVMLGVIEGMRSAYPRSAELFLEAMQHLDEKSTDFRTAVHNFICAFIKCGDTSAISNLKQMLKSYDEQATKLGEFSKMRTRWMFATAEIRTGNSRHAKQLLNGVVKYLRKKGSAREIACALIDLAEACYRSGESKSAVSAMKQSREYLQTIPGLSSEGLECLSEAIRTACEHLSPWDVREHVSLQP